MGNQQQAHEERNSMNDYVNDTHLTALENLYALVLLMLRRASQQVPQFTEKKNALFLDGFVIDQSPQTYRILLDLLKKTKQLSSEKTDREKEIVDFLFDGFSQILLNNIQALFEAEQANLDIVFKYENLPSGDDDTTQKADYLQKTFYPELLKLLLWRQKDLGSDPDSIVKKISPWQNVLRFETLETLKTIYSESDLENKDSLYEKHLSKIPSLLNLEDGL